jgi:hypothetical protein
MGESERVDLGPFMSRRSFVGYVASRPDKNRIGLRRRQQQLRSSTVCQEKLCAGQLFSHMVAAQKLFDGEERG